MPAPKPVKRPSKGMRKHIRIVEKAGLTKTSSGRLVSNAEKLERERSEQGRRAYELKVEEAKRPYITRRKLIIVEMSKLNIELDTLETQRTEIANRIISDMKARKPTPKAYYVAESQINIKIQNTKVRLTELEKNLKAVDKDLARFNKQH